MYVQHNLHVYVNNNNGMTQRNFHKYGPKYKKEGA